MNFSIYRFTLDLHKHQSQMSIAVFQYDTAIKLSIGITDGGVPYYLEDGVVAVLFGEKENGEPIAHNCMIEENTRIIYTFNKETANEIGVVNCQIRFYKDGEEILAAPKFIIVVGERVVNDTQVFDSGDGAFEEQFSALDNLFTSESARIVAENARVEAENERAGNELLREEKELTRQTFETQRQTEEAKRVKAEEERAEAETKREEGYAKLENKVDKTSEASKIYGTNVKGENVLYSVADNPVGGAIPRYNYNAGSKYTLRTADAVTELDCVNKRSFESVVNPLTDKQSAIEARVTDLESLTLSYPEITSTDYEKIVPAEAGKFALVKMIGGATKSVSGANSFNPLSFDLFSSGYTPIHYTVDENGYITFTLYYSEGQLLGRSEINLYDGEYQIFVEGNGQIFLYINQVDENAARVEIEFPLPEGEEYGDQWYADEYTYTVRIMVTKIRSEEGFISVTEAPSGTVFEPYVEPHFKHADVERIESLGKNRLPSDVMTLSNWVFAGNYAQYYLDLSDGWYCLSMKLKEGYDKNTYLHLYKSTDDGANYLPDSVGYDANGYLRDGYMVAPSGLLRTALWFRVDKKARIVYCLHFPFPEQSKLDWIYDIQIEKVNLAQAPSTSYQPSVHAPATAYSPYKSEPIDTITIPVADIKNRLSGLGVSYGMEGNYLEFLDDEVRFVVTKDENFAKLPEPTTFDVTDLFTEDNAIEVQGGGVLRFVNEHEIPVPNTVGFITRKE